MIDKYIEEEKNKIKGLVSIIKELKSQLDNLISQRDIAAQEIEANKAKIVQLGNEASSLRAFHKAKSFNFFERHIFKRKEYKQYKQDEKEYNKTREQKIAEYKTCEEKEVKLMETKSSLEVKISILQSKINSYNVEQILNEANLIKSGDKQKIIELLLAKHPGLATNIDIMTELVAFNPGNIQYDKTNNEELYKLYLTKKLEQISMDSKFSDEEKQVLSKSYKQCLEELVNPKTVEEGKYKIPHSYLLEELRSKTDTVREGFKGDILHTPSGNVISGFNSEYLEKDGEFDYEYGTQIQELYESEDSYLAIHGSREGKPTMEIIMSTGLKGTVQGLGNLDLRSNAMYKPELYFFYALAYRLNQYCALLLIPKEGLDKSDSPIKIWGKKEKDAEDTYILPQYVYGYMDPDNNGSRKIVINDHTKDEHYPYTYYNRSIESHEEMEL